MEAMNSYRRVYMAYTKQPYDHVPIYCGSVSSACIEGIGKRTYVGGGVQRYREALALWQERKPTKNSWKNQNRMHGIGHRSWISIWFAISIGAIRANRTSG